MRANTAGGRYLERRGGDGGYMVITQASDTRFQSACRQRAGELGVRVAWELAHDDGHFMQLHPRDTGGCFLEIDSVNPERPAGTWPPAGGMAWRQYATPGARIAAVVIQSDTPAQLAARWSAIIDCPVTHDADGHPVIVLLNATLRFETATDGRGDGLGGIDLRVPDASVVLKAAAMQGIATTGANFELGGVRWRIAQGGGHD